MITGLLTGNVLPAFDLAGSDGRRHQRRDWYNRANIALFVLHGASCRACRALLASLSDAAAALEEWETAIVPVVADSEAAVTALARELDLPFALLADPEGALRRRLLNPGEHVALLLADRYGGVLERDAGDEAALPGGAALVEAARFVAIQCPECTDWVPWGES